MANKKRISMMVRPPVPQSPPAGPAVTPVPEWIGRVQSRLHAIDHPDAVRKIFLERAIEGVIQLTQTLPTQALQETATAGTNVLVLLRALKAPELLPELERYEPLASSYLKGLEVQKELLKKAGGLLSAENVGEVLRVTRQAIDKQRQAGKLIAIPKGANGYGYPACQFEAKGTIRGLDAVLGALGSADGWAQLTFLICPNSSLDGRNPLDLLRAGQIERVVEAAGMFGEHGAL